MNGDTRPSGLVPVVGTLTSVNRVPVAERLPLIPTVWASGSFDDSLVCWFAAHYSVMSPILSFAPQYNMAAGDFGVRKI